MSWISSTWYCKVGFSKKKKKWKLGLRAIISTLFEKYFEKNSQALFLYCFINSLRYTKPLGPIQIYFTLFNFRIPLEGLLLNMGTMLRTVVIPVF